MLTSFFASSGIAAWLWLTWRAWKLVKGLPHRIRWALWGYRRKKVLQRIR